MKTARWLALALLVASPVLAGDDFGNFNQPQGFSVSDPAIFGSTPFGSDAGAPSSGAVSLSIPIGPAFRVSSALSYQLSVNYTSAIWRYDDATVCYLYTSESEGGGTVSNCIEMAVANVSNDFNAGAGWTMSFGHLYRDNSTANPTPNWIYVSPTGSRHKFYNQLHETENEEPSTGAWRSHYTRDGSYLRLFEGYDGLDYVDFPDGTRHVFNGDGVLVEIADRFGNSLKVEESGNNSLTTWTVSEWMNETEVRAHEIHFKNWGVGPLVVEYVDFAPLNEAPYGEEFVPGPEDWVFHYQARDTRRTCLDTSTANNDGNGDEWEFLVLYLARIEGAEGMAWDFTTDGHGPDNSPAYHRGSRRSHSDCSHAGTLEKMTYPTGGTVTWDYQNWTFSSTGFPFLDQAPGIRIRTHTSPHAADSSGTWTYSTLLGSGDNKRTEVTDPLGNKTTYYVYKPNPGSGNLHNDYGLPINKGVPIPGTEHTLYLSRKVEDPLGQVLQETYLSYRQDAKPGGVTGPLYTNRRVRASRTVFPEDGSWIEKNFNDYDGLGHYRETTTTVSWNASDPLIERVEWSPSSGCYSDCPAGAPGYVHPLWTSPWINATYSAQSRKQGGVVLKSTADFDLSTGALFETRRFANSGTGSVEPPSSDADVITRLCFDGAGNVISKRLYGGDTQSLSTVTPGCDPLDGAAYRTDTEYQYNVAARSYYVDETGQPMSFDLFSATIDPLTGLASTSCESSGYCRDLTYDGLRRVVETRASAGSGDQATATVQATFAYDPAPEGGWYSETTMSCPTGSSVPCYAGDFPTRRSYLSGFGRPYKTKWKNFDGTWSKQVRLFDAAGNVLRESSRVDDAVADASAPATVYAGYDVFGRPATRTAADGHVTSYAYTGTRERSRTVSIAMALDGTETPVTTYELYDEYGRLVEVREPSMPDGSYATAAYTYDLNGQLTQIAHQAGAVVQYRKHTYDALGRMRTESLPERTGRVFFNLYDAAGLLCNRSGAKTGNRTYVYDRAGRLMELYVGGTEPLKVFTYDAAPGLGLGKLATATRVNHLVDHGVVVKESFEYNGIGGSADQIRTLVSDRDTQAVLADFEGGVSLDPGRQLRQISYPVCAGGANCTALPPGSMDRTVAYDRQYGWVRHVDGYAGLWYQKNGWMSHIWHTNGVTDWRGMDSSSMIPRMQHLIVKDEATQIQLLVNTYIEYDGAGNIKALTGLNPHAYRYDAVSRLVESVEPGVTTEATQETTYDGFGNIQSQTTQGLTISLDTSEDTNRLSLPTVTYGNAGNIETWNGQGFDYDLLGNLKTYTPVTGQSLVFEFAYNADDERIWVGTSDGSYEKFTLRGPDGKLLREYDATSPVGMLGFTDFVWSEAGLVTRLEPSLVTTGKGKNQTVDRIGDLVRHTHLDHLGTIRLVTDESGNVVEQGGYYPFGRKRETSTQPGGISWAGYERDTWSDGTDLNDIDYLMARSYHPTLGRFLQVDPLAGRLSSPQTLNRYAYVSSRPLVFRDPTGQQQEGEVVVLFPAGGMASPSGQLPGGSEAGLGAVPWDGSPTPGGHSGQNADGTSNQNLGDQQDQTAREEFLREICRQAAWDAGWAAFLESVSTLTTVGSCLAAWENPNWWNITQCAGSGLLWEESTNYALNTIERGLAACGY